MLPSPNDGRARGAAAAHYPHHWHHRHRPQKPVNNRIRAILVHIPWYSIEGAARLAADVGVARSTISRLLSGKASPSYAVAERITAALKRRLKRPLPAAEVFTTDGVFPTPSTCQLCGCNRCMPDEAYDAKGNLKPEYQKMPPGDWCLYRPALASPEENNDLPVSQLP